MVLAKAVGPLAVVVELAAPALRPGGLLLVSKTAAAADGEAAAGAVAAAACGLVRGRTVALTRSPLPGSVCVRVRKDGPHAAALSAAPGHGGQAAAGLATDRSGVPAADVARRFPCCSGAAGRSVR